MADGSTITFKFTQQDIYNIDLLNLKQQNNNLADVIKFCGDKKSRVEKLIEIKGVLFTDKVRGINDFVRNSPKGGDD